MMGEDYSYANMERNFRENRKGRLPTPEEQVELQRQSDELIASKKAYDDAVANAEERESQAAAQAALDRIAAKFKEEQAEIDRIVGKVKEKKLNPALRIATVAVVLTAAGVLIGAFGKHPFSYYTVLRWLACSAAVLLVWRGAVQGARWAWALVPLAILFNPIAPIHFSVKTWRTLDIAAAVVMVLALAWMEIVPLLKKK